MNLKDIEKMQQHMRVDICHALQHNKLQYSIDLIDAFADSCQRVNNILRDDEIEKNLEYIAKKYIVYNPIEGALDERTVILYDQIGTTICLGLQYLRALIDKGYEVVYIYESPTHSISQGFLNEVKRVCKDYFIFSSRYVYNSNGEYLGNEVRRIIEKYRPANIFMHQEATGALAMSVMYSLKGITRYKIIPGDHHFYLGYGCFDYFLDFRPFGWSTSHYERRLPIAKIINNTYYPIVNDNAEFEGFQFDIKGKTIVLSGGATYKFEGSNVFYELLEYILSFDNVIFAFMGRPSVQLKEMKNNPKYVEKIHFLGYRKDFSQIIKRIDILFNSYPVAGGLFCQTAAYYGKPILAYSSESLLVENRVEDILGFPEKGDSITLTSKEEFKKRAELLIKDRNFRASKGMECRSMLITKEYFDDRLVKIIKKVCTHITSEVSYVDRSERISINVHDNNYSEPSVFLFPAKIYGLNFFYVMRFFKKDLYKHFKYIFVHAFSRNIMIRRLLKKNH